MPKIAVGIISKCLPC